MIKEANTAAPTTTAAAAVEEAFLSQTRTTTARDNEPFCSDSICLPDSTP